METRSPASVDTSDGPLWYKDAIFYQVPVKSYMDSNGDGIGDFQGLTQKLDYIQDLGVTAIWVQPFYPSPLKDDGYDIADYTGVHPSYGNLRDVRRFVREAHKRGLKVITELVANHTSDQHSWFQRARRAKPGSVYRDFYVWSDDPEKYKEVRIIFKDFETSNWAWDPVADAYYWHRFYHHQPDLNFDNPRVHDAIMRAMDYWFEMGVDGLRLDAIPYLYEREGTNGENLPETHQFLKDLRAHLDEKFENKMLLAEANQWPEDAVEYFGEGDECHMAFHFPVMPRLYMALQMEDHYPIIDIMEQTPEIPENAQWAMFLRNHDELTLEMVTDEERDYMYRTYAHDATARINLGIRRRLAPLMGNNRRRIELLNGVLFSMPGTPVLYYGDEIGMGDNIYLGDRHGVRTPMQWSPDRNAGFSSTNRQRLYSPPILDPEYHFETVNVEVQQRNPQSLLWWMKRLIDLRKRYRAFGRGSLEFLPTENRKILAFVRIFEDERILVVANLSRFVQAAELDLSQFEPMAPVEMFGQMKFPPIGELPYFITLGPHSFYWFSLEPQRVMGDYEVTEADPLRSVPALAVSDRWEQILSGRPRRQLTGLLPGYLRERRWFGGKARAIRSTDIIESIPLKYDDATAHIIFVQLEYTDGYPETYVLPTAHASGERARQVEEWMPNAVIARLSVGGEPGILYDALWEQPFCDALLEVIGRRRSIRGQKGRLSGVTTRAFRSLRGPRSEELPATIAPSEQSNSSIIYGDRLILKLFRRLDEGENPDLEIGRYLTQKTSFDATAPVAGSLNYQPDGQVMTLGILQGFIQNEGDAWSYTLDVLGGYYERAITAEEPPSLQLWPGDHALEGSEIEPTEAVYDVIGSYLDDAETLGRRTAEMHVALASNTDDPAFRPEAFSMLGQRALYQSMRTQAGRTLQTLKRVKGRLSEDALDDAQWIIQNEANIRDYFRSLTRRRMDAMNTRHHGDYHLGQVLYTGRDFVIIDFEGEPARPLSERRLKRSPLRDVAGMLRSFHYAAYSYLLERVGGGLVRDGDLAAVEIWAEYWHRWVAARFLAAYLDGTREATFLPSNRDDLRTLLDAFTLEKAVYELGYELNNRPGWVRIPMRGIISLVGGSR